MTQANMTQANNGAAKCILHSNGKATYRLAKEREYQLQPFGPLLTLAQAQAYQADMILGGFDVLVINSKAV